ncbi:flagellar basal body-associated FliL family protein [Consotaella salsifontis]|uniref:Flagellar protein FliL n=1 Tax=Consotaella salsifontis TaxID=1365950 RepID=A0A1T4NRS2_9HYPH|nr:flagellar basal body-associated FliL family protein [Consotaella salsifontis]SJZ81795.1 flagellar FliL protein [Consotaella salsifontis]
MTDTSADGLEALTALLEENKPKKSPVLPVVLTVAALTLLAVGGGAGIGWLIGGSKPQPAPEKAAGAAEGAAKDASALPESLYGGGPEAGPIALVTLPPVLTNLYSPSNVWVRLQAAVVIRSKEVENADVLAGQIQSDVMTFMRTVQLPQIQGGRGLSHLREDLTERAKMRSPAVLDFIIEALVTE